MTDQEIIQLLGGVTSVARLLNIKPPSVHAWIEGGIPDGRLRDLAAQIEIKSGGRFSRREQWPEKYAFYWPELAQSSPSDGPVAAEPVEPSSPVPLVIKKATKPAPEPAPTDAPAEDQAVIVAVLIAGHKGEGAQQSATQSDHRAPSARRADIPSPYDHSDIDRRGEEARGRRASNGHAVDVVAKGV